MESASTFRDWILVDFVSISSQENLFNIRLTLFMFTSRNHSKCLTIAMHSKHEQFSVLPSLLNSLGVSSHCQKGSSLESLKFSKGIWVVRRRTDCSFFWNGRDLFIAIWTCPSHSFKLLFRMTAVFHSRNQRYTCIQPDPRVVCWANPLTPWLTPSKVQIKDQEGAKCLNHPQSKPTPSSPPKPSKWPKRSLKPSLARTERSPWNRLFLCRDWTIEFCKPSRRMLLHRAAPAQPCLTHWWLQMLPRHHVSLAFFRGIYSRTTCVAHFFAHICGARRLFLGDVNKLA